MPDRTTPASRHRRAIPEVAGFDEETAALSPEAQARLAAAAIAGSELDRRTASSRAADTSSRSSRRPACGSTSDHGRHGARLSPTRARLATPSGRLGRGRLDPAEVGRRRPRRRLSPAARSIEPGDYRAVLEPYALAELLDYFGSDSFGGLGLLEERGYLAGRIGKRVFDAKVSILDDALDPRGLPKASTSRDAEAAGGLGETASRAASCGIAGRRSGPATGTSRRATRRPRPRAWGPCRSRCRSRRRGRVGRRAGRARRQRHPRDPPPLPVRRRPPRGHNNRNDARRHVPHPRRQIASRSSTCASRSRCPGCWRRCPG